MPDPVYETKPTDVHSALGQWILADGLPQVYDPAASEGAHFHDAASGETYLDLFSFFASMPVGHSHPALKDEAYRAKLLAAAAVKPSNSDIYTQAMADFVTKFSRTLPPGFKHLFFIEGGALGVENALKIAFDWKVRKNIERGVVKDDGDPQLGTKVIHFRDAFHGRTGYTLSLTNTADPNKTKYFPKFDWPRVSTPGCRFPVEGDNLANVEKAEAKSLGEIKNAIASNPNEIAALIIETIQGEGGDVHFRPEYFAALRQICDESEIIFICDEVQSGLGMTGKWWAFEHMGSSPDIFCFGKKTQVCGLASNDRVNDVDSCFKVSSRINSTWGGNLVDMVRCAKYIDVIEDHGLLNNAALMGAYLLEKLQGLEQRFDAVSNARGRGLMCAFDLTDGPTRGRAQELIMEHKAIMLPCGQRSLRFRPSLDFTRDNVDEAISKITDALSKL